MAPDPLGAEAGHQSDEQSSADGGQEHEGGVVVMGARGDERGTHPVVEDEIGDQADEPQQPEGDDGAEGADRQSEARDEQRTGLEREVAQAPDDGVRPV